MITFELIIPPEFHPEAIYAELRREAADIQDEVLVDFQNTVKTWSNKPEFTKEKGSGMLVDFSVKTEDELYAMLSKGTPAHNIPLSPEKKAFKIKSGFTPKTTPGVLNSVTGGAVGEDFVKRSVIQHPGTIAREFDQAALDKWAKPVVDRLQAAMDRGARKSRHFFGFFRR